jgi:hypothetical protein
VSSRETAALGWRTSLVVSIAHVSQAGRKMPVAVGLVDMAGGMLVVRTGGV